MLCKGLTIPNFNPKKDNFFDMLHFIRQSGHLLISKSDSCEITVKPQKLEHGNLRTLPKIRTKISVPTKKCSLFNEFDFGKVAHRETRTLEHIPWSQT